MTTTTASKNGAANAAPSQTSAADAARWLASEGIGDAEDAEASDEPPPDDAGDKPAKSKTEKPEDETGDEPDEAEEKSGDEPDEQEKPKGKPSTAQRTKAKIQAQQRRIEELETRDTEWTTVVSEWKGEAEFWKAHASALDARLREAGHAPDPRELENVDLKRRLSAVEAERQSAAQRAQQQELKRAAAQVEEMKAKIIDEVDAVVEKHPDLDAESLVKAWNVACSIDPDAQLSDVAEQLTARAAFKKNATKRAAARKQLEVTGSAPRPLKGNRASAPHFPATPAGGLAFLKSIGLARDDE